MLKPQSNENILYQADVKAYEDTWTHQRRKRRMEQRITDNKHQKTNNNLKNDKTDMDNTINANDNTDEQQITANAKALFTATLVLRKTNNTIWIDMLHLGGNRDSSYQVFQFFKNRFV